MANLAGSQTAQNVLIQQEFSNEIDAGYNQLNSWRKVLMMAEFDENALQLLDQGQNVNLEMAISYNKGYLYHRNQYGILILRGIVDCPNSCFARYQANFTGNVALLDGAKVPDQCNTGYLPRAD